MSGTENALLAALSTTEACGCEDALASEIDVMAVTSTGPVARWEGGLVVEGEMTGDGRLIEKDALRWETPFLLRYVSEDMGAHDGAVVVGRCDSAERHPDGTIWGTGIFDLGSAMGQEAYRQVKNELTNGVSVDLDDVSFEVRIAAELLAEDDGIPILFADDAPAPKRMGHKEGPDGAMIECDPDSDEECVADEEEPEYEVDADGRVTVMSIKSDDEVRVTKSARIRAATIVAIPAFSTARITAFDLEDDMPQPTHDAPSLAAAAAPVAPPADWFNNPRLPGPSPMRITEDGRVYGHLATWGTCHLSYAGSCVEPPHSATGYAYFRTGTVLTREGAEIPVGRITLDTGHAGERLSPTAALAHYENTGKAVADIVVGEDAYGIWVAGACRPTVTPTQMRVLRSAPLSGDWRRIGGNLELVAALGVNVGGFPIPHPAGLVASGAVQSLVAAGMLKPLPVEVPAEDMRYLWRIVEREKAEEAALVASGRPDPASDLARRVRASSLAMRVRDAAERVK